MPFLYDMVLQAIINELIKEPFALKNEQYKVGVLVQISVELVNSNW